MNIFVTSECPEISAYNLCHVHVVKMITESCQMLSTAHHCIDGESVPEGIYKSAYKNHPSNIWCRESVDNYYWLLEHTKALGDVYTLRTGKVHGAISKCLDKLSLHPHGLVKRGLTDFAVAMDEDIKISSGSVQSRYHKYLNRKYLEWLTREKPMKVEFTLEHPHWLSYDVMNLLEAIK